MDNNTKNLRVLPILLIMLYTISAVSCKKLVQVDAPVDNLNSANMYDDDVNAASVLTGLYTTMSSDNSGTAWGGITSLSVYGGLSADELVMFLNNSKYIGYYANDLSSSYNSGTANYWNNFYPQIFTINSAIEGLSNSSNVSQPVKQQLLGEAKFLRAFFYFYLINLFGDVPLVLSTDWHANRSLTRAPKEVVYQEIISDLKDAQQLLNDRYLKSDALTAYPSGSEERVRPTKWAATALLARAYLYIGDYPNAEIQATTVIDNANLFSIQIPLKDVFKLNSKETIWSLQAVGTGTNSNTGDGKLFILPVTGPSGANPIYLNRNVLNSFEANDLRKINWIDSVKPSSQAYYYAKKYKIGATNTNAQEYPIVLRLAEQYLIRADARAQQSKISEAQDDLNVIRARAGLNNTTATDKNSLLIAIMQERKVELFTELGHRWLDLKRTGTIDAVMSVITPQKGGTWSSNKALFPIPLTELQKAPQVEQNSGY